MKLINSKPPSDLIRANRKLEAELLRGMRIKNNERSVSCYGRLAVTGFMILAFLLIMVLTGWGLLSLSNGAIAALTVIMCKVINGYFSHHE